MRWIRDNEALDAARKRMHYDPTERWVLERGARELTSGGGLHFFSQYIAAVERSALAPLFGEGARYQAEILSANGPGWRTVTGLWPSLKEAQQAAEREVRLMEVGELM